MKIFNYQLGEEINLELPKIKRTAVRAVIVENERILLLSSNRGDYKLPGGGVENNESLETALIREVQEETGYMHIDDIRKIGLVTESRIDKYDENKVFEMISHYFLCRVVGEKSEQNLDAYEEELGFNPIWMDIHEAIKLNEKYIASQPDDYGWAMRENLVMKHIAKEVI